MKRITYVTGNQMKVDYLNKALSGTGYKVVQKKLDIPEIQADSVIEVAKFSAKYASDLLKADVLKNDSGLVITALNGFPGPYAKYAEQTLKGQGIINLMKGKKDRTAYWMDCFAYCEYGKEPVCFIAKSYGKISKKLMGKNFSEFDRFFIPIGKTQTMAQLDYEEYLNMFDNSGVEELIKYLNSKPEPVVKKRKKSSSKKQKQNN